MSAIRRILQLIFSVLAIVALLFAVSLFITIPRVSPFVVNNILANTNFSLAVGVVLAICGVIAIVRFLQSIFAKGLHHKLKMEKDLGKVTVSKQAVISTARAAIRTELDVLQYDVDAKLYTDPADTIVNADIKVDKAKDVVAIGERVQAKVKQAAKHTLGVDVKEVNVNVKQIDLEELKEAKKEALEKSRPRVV